MFTASLRQLTIFWKKTKMIVSSFSLSFLLSLACHMNKFSVTCLHKLLFVCVTSYQQIILMHKVLTFTELINYILFLFMCDSDRVIGVHCTHGLNRTGYLVCR